MAKVTDIAADDAYDVWVCPVHGIISEASLLEGHDGTWFGSHPGGDGYTDHFYCDRDHAGPTPEAHLVNVREDVERALANALEGKDGDDG